jgi:transcriptional regulator with XRE-family HTH domain
MKFKYVGEAIGHLRKTQGLTQEELGKKVNLGRVVVAKIENNQRAISLEEAKDICYVLGIGMDTLFGYVEDESNEEDESFVMAFSSKGADEEELPEIRRIELLVEALFTQEQIYRGE